MTIHIISAMPARKLNGEPLPGKFEAFYGEHRIVAASRTPFCDGARALLADGTAQPSDVLIMRHAGSQHDALKAAVGIAAMLTVDESETPRLHKWVDPRKRYPAAPDIAAPMR